MQTFSEHIIAPNKMKNNKQNINLIFQFFNFWSTFGIVAPNSVVEACSERQPSDIWNEKISGHWIYSIKKDPTHRCTNM